MPRTENTAGQNVAAQDGTGRQQQQQQRSRAVRGGAAGLALGAALSVGALAAGGLRITVNGRAVPGTTLSSGGQTYVPVSALSAAGFRVSTSGGVLSVTATSPAAPTSVTGGANPVRALEGCLNQPLFNGVWGARFSNLRFSKEDGPQWKIDLEMRNATPDMLSGADAAQMADSLHLSWLSSDGTPLAWNTTDELAGQKFTYLPLPPAGVWRGTLSVADGGEASAARRPTKLLWLVKPGESGKTLPWGTKDPSFRVNLTCTR